MTRKDHDTLFAIVLLSLLGLLDAGWLSVRSMGIHVRGMCGPVGDCDAVLTSLYAHVLGIPAAVFGTAMYAVLLVLAHRLSLQPEAGGLRRALRALSCTGMIVSAGFMVIQLFVLKAFCLFCTLSAVTVTVIAIFAITLGRGAATVKHGAGAGRYRLSVFSGVAFLFAVFFAAIWVGQQERNTIVGRIGNEVLRQERMNRELAVFSAENERQLVETQISWVNNTLVQRMLDKEARRKQTSLEALAAEVVGGPVVLADSDLAAAFRAFAGPGQELTPDQKNQVRNLLIQQKQEDRLNRYVDSLKHVYGVEVYLESIPVVNPLLDLSGTASFGARGGAATFVVFTDFQCPFCAGVAGLLDEVVKRNPEKVTVYIKHYPLAIHPHAARAAEASLCAHAQGKFKPFHDLLFSHQASLDDASLIRFAGEAGCDTAVFAAALRSGFQRQYVERDIAEAQKNGISGTPTIFLNGRPLMGEVSLERLQADLQAILR
jgi:protein-disulfide isomerase/uncharacterized membrane protein